jgi:hypothetical protein
VAYLYRHIRLDKNEPFYIGIGSDDSYKRAYNPWDRTLFWKNITLKTQYKVDIILDNLSWEEACKKEIEFIALYGRKDLGKGSLVNLTDGGEGVINRNPQTQDNINKAKWKPILQYDKHGNFIKKWVSGKELLNKYPKNIQNIQACCRGEVNSSQGYFWYYEENFKPELIEKNQKYKNKNLGKTRPQNQNRKQILVESIDKSFKKVYSYIKECKSDLNLNVNDEYLRKKIVDNKEYNGYTFSYLSPDQ